MSANKENAKANEMSRKVLKGREEMERNPLKTLSFQGNAENCLAGPSHVSSKQLDTRHVTYKKTNYDEYRDLSFLVYKDKAEPKKTDIEKSKFNEKKIESHKLNETYTISSSTLNESNFNKPETEPAEQINKVNTENVAPVTMTIKTPLIIIESPDLPDVNVNTVDTEKRVKRTLKRSQARSSTDSPVSAKSCQFSIRSDNDLKVHLTSSGDNFDPLNPYVMDNLNYLLHTERKIYGEPRIRNASRSRAINWIINVNGSDGNPAVVQLAVWYFDSYMSMTWVTMSRLQLIAAACFWIATKFHGRLISAKSLVEYSDHAFIEMELVTAERSILQKMQFQPLPVAPHDFVPYFAWRADHGKAELVEVAAAFLCQCGFMTEKSISEEYPSVVAAAAVRNALLLLRMGNCLPKMHDCPLFKAAENKAVDLRKTCSQLRDAVRVVASVGYEYKAPLIKFSVRPYFISNKIIRAVSYKDIMLLDS